jgi:hypothetical protein
MVVDTRQTLNERRNGTVGIKQGLERIDNGLTVVPEHRNFRHPGWSLDAPGSFNINNTIHAVKIVNSEQ